MNNSVDLWRAQLQPELSKGLSELCRRGGYEPVALEVIEADHDLLTRVLKQSILLREAGAVELSLALLNQAEAGGLRSGWIQDNRARALLLLQRHGEAKKLWLGLRQQSNETLRNIASEQLEQLELEERIPEIWSQLQCIAKNNGWACKYLSSGLIRYAEFERAVLEEVIVAREMDAGQFSFELIEFALQSGFRSPWLRDNKARFLLGQGEVLEACCIWRELEAHSDLSDLRAEAARMLQSCRRQEQRALAGQREQRWLESARQLDRKGDLLAAETELVRGWIDCPESQGIEDCLIQFMAQRRCKEDPLWSELSPWLQQAELSLEAHEALLGAVERWING